MNEDPKILKIRSIRDACYASSQTKRHDIECWNMYNEFQDDSEFDYLQKIGDHQLPARVRNIGKQRSKINNLVSLQTKRPFSFSVSAVDKNSLNQKYELILNEWIKEIDNRLIERHYQINAQVEMISKKIQELDQSVQAIQQQENVDPAQLSQYQDAVNLYKMQYSIILDKMSREKLFTDTELEEKQKYLKYEFRDIAEEYSQKLLQKSIEVLEIRQESTRAFISHCVTGKAQYFVDYIPGMLRPTFKVINNIKTYFPDVESIRYINKLPWNAIEENWSMEEVMRMYGQYLTENQKRDLRETSILGQSTDIAVTPSMGALFLDNPYSGSVEKSNTNSVKVLRIWYKEERPVHVKYSPNPHEKGQYFRKFLPSGKKIISSKDYNYKNGSYINKQNPEDRYNQKDVSFINGEKGEYINTSYMLDRYRAVVLNDRITINLGLDPVQPRSIDSFWDVMMPIIGKSFSTITDRPYSLLWSTRDLQKLYKIVHYHRELYLAISGTKGTIVDLSQKPEGMTRKEWEYHKKRGTIYINTVDKNGRKINSSFNQWQTYDETVSASIQYLDAILDSIDNEISETMGIPRQRMGSIVGDDQVGTSKIALQQSLLTTEILYAEHDNILGKALSQYLNIYTKYCAKEEEVIEMFDMNGFGREYIKVPYNLIKDKDWEVLLSNNGKDEERIESLKQLAIRQNDKGLLSFSNLFEIFNTDSLTSLRKKFEYFNKKSEEIQAMQGESQKNNAIEIERAKAELKAQYEQFAIQEKTRVEEAKLAIAQQKLKQDQNIALLNLDLDQKKLQQDKDLKIAELETENIVEMAYLKNMDTHATNSENIQLLQMKLNTMIEDINLRLQKDSNDKKHTENIQKLEIDKRKVNKEKIKD